MNTPLDPIVSEFETQKQADSYDCWFRIKVQEAMGSDKPRLPHDEAMALVDSLIAECR
ncbi:stability determinant [Pistricoccus aurantiacus]|uniref:Stability determinant n=2 Tax=Pistricoccus aurantiacus TaxID=1883414 RepID=A0A5B8SW15_9GAMM|nr:stability determinant [Pistricoccus aurantiacus]